MMFVGEKKRKSKTGRTPITEDPKLFDPGKAKRDLERLEYDHDAVAQPIWAAVEYSVNAISSSSPGDKIIVALLHAMRETHDSMRAIFIAAQKIEAMNGPTGRCVDMLLLARPQYDAAFIALLMAQDENTWVPKYGKAGWAANVRLHFFMFRRFEKMPSGAALKKSNIERLTMQARRVGVTQQECNATIADVLDESPPAGTTNDDRIKPLPTPMILLKHLKDGPYEELGRLLYQQWKFLCDPAHVGIASLWLRGIIRGGQPGAVPSDLREEFIHNHVVAPAIVPSLVAIMSVVSLFAYRHKDNPDLLAAVVEAWRPLERGTIEGSIIWDGWARQALGVLEEE